MAGVIWLSVASWNRRGREHCRASWLADPDGTRYQLTAAVGANPRHGLGALRTEGALV